MAILKTWFSPTYSELVEWAHGLPARWLKKHQAGTAEYGPIFQGDPLIHLREEIDDIISYQMYAQARTERHVELLSEAAMALLSEDADYRLLMSRALNNVVDAYISRQEWHETRAAEKNND